MSKARAQLNSEIADIVNRSEEGILAGKQLTPENADYIQQYTGDGGLKGAETRGTLYEYYTPMPIVQAMWALAYKYGFKSGRILEPSCGVGRFLKYVDPTNNTVDAFEYSKDNKISFLIAKACYPWANITNDFFESIFYKDNKRVAVEPSYDLVIGNPPYGKFTGFYAGDKREKGIFPGRTYDQYFIWAGMELLKPGGLLVFIIPSTLLQNSGSYADFAQYMADNAELLEAYRMPKGLFDHTDLMTDIVVFKRK